MYLVKMKGTIIDPKNLPEFKKLTEQHTAVYWNCQRVGTIVRNDAGQFEYFPSNKIVGASYYYYGSKRQFDTLVQCKCALY